MAIAITSLDHIAEIPLWVDREQMELFMDEYERSSDKQRLLGDRQKQLAAIRRVCLTCFKFSIYFVSLIHF